jgi:predicted ribosomally synthesized peptide with SipW-like signal peptide
MKKIFKSLLVMSIALGTSVIGTGAYFTSTVSASNNQIVAGTLRLAIDSTQTHISGPHTWGFPNAYTIVEDDNGVSTQLNTLETWMNAAPGPYVPYVNTVGADVLPDGNHSYWIAFRNKGTIPMKVKGNVTGGTWTPDAGVLAANPTCTAAHLNSGTPTVAAPNVTFYGTTGGSNICKSHEECENIYYGLTSGPWTYSSDPTIAGADINLTPPSSMVYLSSNGLSTGTPIVLKPSEFVIARVDGHFNTSDNCYQGATYTYNLNGFAYQTGDATW